MPDKTGLRINFAVSKKLQRVHGTWVHFVVFRHFNKGDNFYDFLFAILHTKFFLKWGLI